jgi:hypothetical protein
MQARPNQVSEARGERYEKACVKFGRSGLGPIHQPGLKHSGGAAMVACQVQLRTPNFDADLS